MISIRPFEESDNQNLLDIEALCPQGNERCAMGVRKEDIIARYRMYDSWKVIIAEVDGRVAGWAGWTVKENPDGNERYGYLAEVMIHPEFRRMGVARRLAEEAEKDARESGADHLYCYIYEPNAAPKSLFKGLGYSNVADIKSVAMPVYKRAEPSTSFSAERMKKDEIESVVELINGRYRGWRHFSPFSADSFESHLESIPGYGLDNFWVAKDEEDGGKVVGCAGLWDYSTLAEFCYIREPVSWKVLGLVLRSLARFTKVPKIAREGEYFQCHYLTDYAFDRRNPAGMQNLLCHLNNVLLEKGMEYFVAMVEPEDPVFPLLKKRQPQIETWNLFAKSFDGKLPDFSPFYVDIRDMIL
jgi:ribosomal protein S18 acetylase RimI-like enzyme